MSAYISVNPPKNLTIEDEHLFLPHLRYRLGKVKAKWLNKVFITYSGLCVNNTGIIKECHHRYRDYYNGYTREVEAYQQRAVEDPDSLVILDNENVYLSIFHPWYNYYHWICESIFRLWMVKDQLAEMILVLPDFYRHSDFIISSLRGFQFRDIYFIPPFKSLLVRHLCLPQIKPFVDSYDKEKLLEVRQFYLDYASSVNGLGIDLGKRLYVSRKKAARKRIHNEEEVEQLLKERGFTILNNEDYSFLEQVSLFSNAEYLISIHGSGLTNMLFMQKNAHVLEFHKKKTNDQDWHSRAFWYLADALGHSYYHQLCDPTDPSGTYYTADLIVDMDKLAQNLSYMAD